LSKTCFRHRMDDAPNLARDKSLVSLFPVFSHLPICSPYPQPRTLLPCEFFLKFFPAFQLPLAILSQSMNQRSSIFGRRGEMVVFFLGFPPPGRPRNFMRKQRGSYLFLPPYLLGTVLCLCVIQAGSSVLCPLTVWSANFSLAVVGCFGGGGLCLNGDRLHHPLVPLPLAALKAWVS